MAGILGVVSTSVQLHPAQPLWGSLILAGGFIGAEYRSKRLGNPTIQRLLALVLPIAGIKMLTNELVAQNNPCVRIYTFVAPLVLGAPERGVETEQVHRCQGYDGPHADSCRSLAVWFCAGLATRGAPAIYRRLN